MSKILDLLNYNSRKEKKKEEKKDLLDNGPFANFDSQTKEKLADTYLFGPADSADKKPEKKILPHTYNSPDPKISLVRLFPWFISFLAVLLLLVNIAFRGRINFKIEIVDEADTRQHAPVLVDTPRVPTVAETPSEKKDTPPEEEKVEIPPVYTSLIAEGQPNRYVIKRVGFYGAALNKSRLTDDGLYLHNDGTTGWASTGIDLAEPMDLSSSALEFFVKGSFGNESLELILRDADNNSYMPQARNVIFNKSMGQDWQFVSVPLNSFSGSYNAKKIKHIGFEFGTQTTSNKPGTSFYIKKIKLVMSGPSSS